MKSEMTKAVYGVLFAVFQLVYTCEGIDFDPVVHTPEINKLIADAIGAAAKKQ